MKNILNEGLADWTKYHIHEIKESAHLFLVAYPVSPAWPSLPSGLPLLPQK
jgi:hypothetical protein